MPRPSLSGPAVVVDGVDKTFVVPQERVHTFKERAMHPLRRNSADRFEALRDVSFTVDHGEFFGIVGRNGSGKSTLLKCLAGIYGIDRGHVHKRGRMSTFIELGVGFNPDLAARDNATLNAIMLGLDRREAESRYERIIEFSELQEFQDLKIKNYSSGMLVRLAFSVMIQVDADILLIDEVLAVGDASFQQKCFDEFARLRDERRTILFVTHDMGAVEHYCDRAMALEKGRCMMLGEPSRVATEYFELNFGRGGGADATGHAQSEGQSGDGRARIEAAWFEDADGQPTTAIRQGDTCAMCMSVTLREAIDDPIVGFALENGDGQAVFATSTRWTQTQLGSFADGDGLRACVRFDADLAPGKYHLTVSTSAPGTGDNVLDRRARFASVQITGSRATGGMVDLPHELTVQRASKHERSGSS